MIHSLRHFALGVPDLAAGADFYTTFGLNKREVSGRDLAFRCDGQDHDVIALQETGQGRKFQYVSFGADAEGLASIAQNLERRGIERLQPPASEAAPDGLWFRDPDGSLVNVHVASKVTQAAE